MQGGDGNLTVVDGAKVGAVGRLRHFVAEAHPVVVAVAQVGALLGVTHGHVAEGLAGDLDLGDVVGRPRGEVDVHHHVLGPADLDQPLDDAGAETLGRGEHVLAVDQRPAGLRQGDRRDAHGHALDGAGDGARQRHVFGQVGAAVDARQHQVGRQAAHQLGDRQHHAIGRRAGGGEAAVVQLPHPHRIGQGQGAAGARLLVLRRADPDVVGQGAGDVLQRDEAFSVDAVVVGQEDFHSPPICVRPGR